MLDVTCYKFFYHEVNGGLRFEYTPGLSFIIYYFKQLELFTYKFVNITLFLILRFEYYKLYVPISKFIEMIDLKFYRCI